MTSTTTTDQIIEVPHDSLQPDTLRRVVEEFVSRDGTDYGVVEKALEQKINDVMRQLERGEAKVVYDQRTGSVNIVAPTSYGPSKISASS